MTSGAWGFSVKAVWESWRFNHSKLSLSFIGCRPLELVSYAGVRSLTANLKTLRPPTGARL